jgi:hypothetical protein
VSTKRFLTSVCDRCGKTETVEDGDKSELNLQRVDLRVTNRYGDAQRGSKFFSADWCFNCCVQRHLLKPPMPKADDPTPAPTPDPTPPTIEDLIREIVREEMES